MPFPYNLNVKADAGAKAVLGADAKIVPGKKEIVYVSDWYVMEEKMWQKGKEAKLMPVQKEKNPFVKENTAAETIWRCVGNAKNTGPLGSAYYF
ncbi:MAG: hypothetical protein WCY41_05830 [Candidatus Micrarchaeia archaeon]|jgi:hypothetical protein